MFHAMLFTGFSEDGSSPLPALNLWPRATERFQSSMSDYPWGGFRPGASSTRRWAVYEAP